MVAIRNFSVFCSVAQSAALAFERLDLALQGFDTLLERGLTARLVLEPLNLFFRETKAWVLQHWMDLAAGDEGPHQGRADLPSRSELCGC